ncbi:MAG: MFS transporter [Spirochaetes bacterium]|nr:MFS transporter [Spirochaetota bacterium]
MQKKSHSPVKMSLGLMVLAFAAYISLGLPDGLLGVAWPSIRHTFSLNHDAFGALMIAFTAGYLTSSFFGGRLMAHFRLGTLLTFSTFSAAAALLAYSAAPFWWVMVTAGVAAGLGGGGIDVTLNYYVAARHGDNLMQWLHGSYGIGATIGPVIMTTAITMSGSWQSGYLAVGLVQMGLMACFLFTIPMWENSKTNPEDSQDGNQLHNSDISMKKTLMRPRVWLSISLFFIYMGVEVAFGAWSYSLLTESRGVSAKLAGYWVSSFWGIFTIGRFMAGIYTSRISRLKLVTGSLLISLFATVILTIDINNILSLAAVTVIGLAIAPVLPALISGTADRVGREYTANAIGIQIAAMGIGGAVISSLSGVIAKSISLEAIPVFMIILILVLILSNTYAVKAKKSF